MSDVDSEELEDEGPNLGVSVVSYFPVYMLAAVLPTLDL